MLGWLAIGGAWADCARVDLEDVSLAADGATAMAVRGVVGELEIVADDGDTVRGSGSACAAGAEIKLVRKDGVLVATVKVPRDVDGLSVKLLVPRALAALTVDHPVGEVHIEGLMSRLAVVNGVGDVTVRGGGSLRVANLVGRVTALDLTGELVLDGVTGQVIGPSVRGDVVHLP